MVIALFRYHTAPEVGPEHPYKDVLREQERTWYFNDLWLAFWSAYLLTVELGAPLKWHFQPWLTITPAMILFTTAIRVQLNPISGNYRHRMIWVQLFTDPYQDEVRMKRDYLLAGSDWFGNFSLQSLLEMLSFLFALMPLIIASGQWYTGDPIAANFHGFRIALSTGAYLLLLLTWPLIKKLNRRTRRVLDQTIQMFKGGPKNNCKDLGSSNVMYCERSDMATSDKDEAFHWLDKAVQEHSDGLAFLNVDPTDDPLRSDPRFQVLLRHLRLSQ